MVPRSVDCTGSTDSWIVLLLYFNPLYVTILSVGKYWMPAVSTAGIQYFPTDRMVTYNGLKYNQSTIQLSVLPVQSTDLGTITVSYLNPNDPINPPPPPDFGN